MNIPDGIEDTRHKCTDPLNLDDVPEIQNQDRRLTRQQSTVPPNLEDEEEEDDGNA